MDEFSRTRAGMKFLNVDLPAIAKQLERIAEGLDKKNQIEEKRLMLEHKKYIREGRLLKENTSEDEESLEIDPLEEIRNSLRNPSK
jgi:hypothetical protein